MKIELKNVKHAAFASDETECFEAAIYINGKRRGTASNDGRGGMTYINPPGLQKELDAYGATLPNLESHGISLKQDAELIVGELLDQWLNRRDLKRMCAKWIVFRDPGVQYKPGDYHTLKFKYTTQAADRLRKETPGVVIFNETMK